MNTTQTARLTGIPEDILIRMRSRETVSLKSGPPFCKTMTKDGMPKYSYKVKDVRQWMKMRTCLITAKDAALIMNVSREEILACPGVAGFDINRADGYKGRVIINNAANLYLWVVQSGAKKSK